MSKDLSLAKAQSTQRYYCSIPFAILTIPFLIKATLKLINKPSRASANRRYVKSCFLWTSTSSATDLISTITFSSTTKSARNPISILVPSKTTGITRCVATCSPRFSNWLAIAAPYTLSNSSGPSPRCIRRATSTTSLDISFSVISNQYRSFLCVLCAFARDSFFSAAS